MKKFLVIGNPIQHSLSPKLHNFWFEKNKINAVYNKKEIEEKDIESIISEIKKEKINGINVTVPFKKKVILSEKDYQEIIDRKTAELFKASAITAGALSSCNQEEFISLTNFAVSLGMNFQIKDDLLDYFGDEKLTGKKQNVHYSEQHGTIFIDLMNLKNG